MKVKLLIGCVVGCLALALSGCATYTGGVGDNDEVIYGADGTVYDAETGAVISYPTERNLFGAPRRSPGDLHPSRMINPYYKQPSPSGNDFGGTRPEFDTYWDYYYWR